MNLKGIIKGSIISLITAALFLVISAVLVYFNILSEQTVSTGLFVGIVIGILLGAFIAARNAYSRIIVNSLSVSLLFVLLTLIGSAITNGGLTLHIRTTVLLISTVAAGILGAMLGKNQ